MILYIRLSIRAHGCSSRPAAYLKGARLERSMESWRRETKILATSLSIRSKQSLCRYRYDPQALQ
jgi:hypothetical protein